MSTTLEPVSRQRFESLTLRIPSLRIAVVGDLMLDRYLLGDTERISPEAPVPVVTVDDENLFPGGAANAAVNVRTIGCNVDLVGVLGADSDGLALSASLHALGISTANVITVDGRITTTKTRLFARGQQVARIDREVTNALPPVARAELISRARQAIAECDALLFEDYDKGTLDGALAAELIAAARARPVPIIVDPKQRNFFGYAGATVFKPNLRELDAAFMTQFNGDDADLDGARQRLGADHLLLTLGAAGMALVSSGSEIRRAVSAARDVFDVSGAGDTVAAWIATMVAAGADIGEAAWIANVAAGIGVGKRGTTAVTVTEVSRALD